MKPFYLCLTAIAAVFVGCGKAPETNPKAQPLKIPKPKTVSVTDEKISFVQPTMDKKNRLKDAAAALQKEVIPIPESFPQDIVLPSDTHVISARDLEKVLELTFQTSTTTNALIAMYKKQMAAKGWKYAGDKGEGLIFSKDKRRVLVDIASIDDETTVTISAKPTR